MSQPGFEPVTSRSPEQTLYRATGASSFKGVKFILFISIEISEFNANSADPDLWLLT